MSDPIEPQHMRIVIRFHTIKDLKESDLWKEVMALLLMDAAVSVVEIATVSHEPSEAEHE